MRIIGVVSGKGGVGKTTTVSNLGAALAQIFRRRVVVVDANLTTPNLGLHFGMYHYSATFVDALKRKIPISHALHTHPTGVNIIPTSLSTYSYSVGGDEMKEVLKGLELFEFVLLDSAPGVEREAVPVFEVSDEIIVVTNPEVPALTDALKSMKLAESIGVPVLGVEVNRFQRKERYMLDVYEIEGVCDAPVIAVIPERREVRKSIAIGRPVVINDPFSPAAIEFKRMAARLIGERYEPKVIDRLKWRLGFRKRS